METFPALLALWEGNSPVIGEFLSQRPMTRAFDVFFDLRLNKRLSKQSRRRWFETPSRLLFRHCNVAGTGSIPDCRFNDLRGNQWRQSVHYEDARISAFLEIYPSMGIAIENTSNWREMIPFERNFEQKLNTLTSTNLNRLYRRCQTFI